MLTAKVQYAIVILKELQDNTLDKAVRLVDIADKHTINLDFVEQVARMLRIAGIINSVRGPGGGYMAAKDLMTVTLEDVVNAVHPEKDLKPAIKSDTGGGVVSKVYEKLIETIKRITVL